MSVFSDEDLRWLKGMQSTIVDPDEMTQRWMALIVRLEAAEYALLRMYILKPQWTAGIEEAMEVWRKAAGKGGA